MIKVFLLMVSKVGGANQVHIACVTPNGQTNERLERVSGPV